jgi:hypothetical protein
MPNLKPPSSPSPKNKTPEQREALYELARRRGLLSTDGEFRPEHYLFDKQLAFVNDPAPFKVAVTTRRAGKSVSCVADLTATALDTPDIIVLYITLSRKNAKRLVWPLFKKLNDRYKLGGDVNESDLSIRYPNGSMLYLLGASDRTSIEDFRGLPVKKAYLDEGQSFPTYIEQLIDDVLGPALMDYDGQLILIGTPGPVPSGYFYDLTKNPGWSHHSWSFFDNPKLPFLSQGKTHQQMLDRELARRGVSTSDPSIQREWFGKWMLDENSLVYKYDAGRNNYTTLPGGNWTHILGVDLGYVDADALAVLAYSDQSPDTYLLEEVVTKSQDITSLCAQIDLLRAKYEITKIIVDTGGLGKKITEEMSKRYTIPMIAAEKTRKVEYIELMNSALRTGRLKIKAGSRFSQDAMKVEWDWDKSTPDKKVISDRYHSDICEAVLYAWRESYSYTYQKPKQEPEFASPEWGAREADKMFEVELERAEQKREEENRVFEQNGPDFTSDPLENAQPFSRPTLRYQSRFDRKRKT